MSMAALEKFRTLIAATDEWQDITGAADATEALAFIHWYGTAPRKESGSALDDPPQMYISNSTSERRRVADSTYRCEGSFVATLELPRPDQSSWAAEYKDVYDSLDRLRDEMLVLSGTTSGGTEHVILSDLSIVGPTLAARGDSRDVWIVRLNARWPDR